MWLILAEYDFHWQNMIYTGLLSLLLAENAANQKCSALLCRFNIPAPTTAGSGNMTLHVFPAERRPYSNRSICPGSHRPCSAYYASSVNKLIEVPSEGQTRVGPDGDATWRIWWIDMCSADDAAVATITVAICQRFSDWYYSAFIAVYWQYLSCCVTETHFIVQHDWWVLLRHPVAVATESACLPGTWQRQMALYVVSHGIVHCYKAV